MLSAAVFIAGQNKYIKTPPQRSPVVDAIRVLITAFKEKGFKNAKPTSLRERGVISKYSFASESQYTDEYVTDVQRGLKSCKVRLWIN